MANPQRSCAGKSLDRIIHGQRKTYTTVSIEGRDWKGEAQRRTASMLSLVLGSAVAFFSGVRATNSVSRLLQGTRPLPHSGRLALQSCLRVNDADLLC
jgi:hypothetical protein